MAVPNLEILDVKNLIPNGTVIGPPLRGGQKQVYPCIINGKKEAAKFFLLIDDLRNRNDISRDTIDGVTARARREIFTMKQINSPYVVKLGSIEPQIKVYSNQLLLYYTEEWIDGNNLENLLKIHKKLPYKEVVKICIDIVKAIESIWYLNIIHRDVKPANISQRSTGEYVLLDLGVAYDLQSESLTEVSCIAGTPQFYSPEQLDLSNKRNLDFRSDIFSLGIVAYKAMIGAHPFCDDNTTKDELIWNIAHKQVQRLNEIDSSIPKEVSDIVYRMLNKNPNERYRKCRFLIDALNSTL